MASTQSDNRALHTMQVPRAAKTSPLWQRFLESLMDLPHPKGADQAEIGRAVGVGQTMISSIKTGEKNPSIETALELATYADMCVEYLLTGKGPRRPWGMVDQDFQRLIQFWETLDDSNRTKLLDRAEELYTLQGKARRPRNPLNHEPPHKLTRKAPN